MLSCSRSCVIVLGIPIVRPFHPRLDTSTHGFPSYPLPPVSLMESRFFECPGLRRKRSGAVLGDCPPIPPVLAKPHHLGPVRVQFHPGIVAGVMGGQVALLVERVEPAEPASRGR